MFLLRCAHQHWRRTGRVAFGVAFSAVAPQMLRNKAGSGEEQPAILLTGSVRYGPWLLVLRSLPCEEDFSRPYLGSGILLISTYQE
ncbi:hypothetical protein TREES_T100007901 [Tupaia chinensis]|uniref:Uncharacterized protein n=1 Tax=Tupaia chinensis TaxID=246437 RepID=L9JDQ6_TUPCH|nr:hypothetical protein TREES_T100007901 [Tupaia chinensis]